MADNTKTLCDVLAAFRQAEADLAWAIDSDATEEIRRAEFRLSQMHSAVCQYPSQTPTELSAQLRFLLDRLMSQTGVSDESVDYRELCGILTNRLDKEITTPLERPEANLGYASAQPDYPDPLDSLSASALVSQSTDRISIISTDYRYLSTSIGNARFYGKGRRNMLGSHVAEIIGATRFEARARARLDACFNGVNQDYSHILEFGGESRIMNCRMSPVRDRHNALIGAQVTMSDVTSLYRGEAPLVPCTKVVSGLDTDIRKRA